MEEAARTLSGGGEDGFSFEELYYSLVFLSAVFFAGKLAAWVRMPPLVGEIMAGVLLGPYGLHVRGVCLWCGVNRGGTNARWLHGF